MKKSSRTALSWPRQYRDNIEPLQQMRAALRLGGGRSISNGQLFLIAAILAFNAGQISSEKIPAANNSVRVVDLKNQRRILEAIALSTQQSRRVLLTEDEVFDIAEKYASEGLRILFEARESRTAEDFALYVSSEIYNALKNNTN